MGPNKPVADANVFDTDCFDATGAAIFPFTEFTDATAAFADSIFRYASDTSDAIDATEACDALIDFESFEYLYASEAFDALASEWLDADEASE